MRDIICINTFRIQARIFQNPALNNETKDWHRRTDKVSFQVTFLSWILEFIGGIFILITYMFFGRGHAGLSKCVRLFDICLTYIVLPCTYILNREVTKQKIVLGNWYQGIKSIFIPGGQVAPAPGANAVPQNPPAPSTDAVVPNESAEEDRSVPSSSRRTESYGVASILSHTPPVPPSNITVTLTNQQNSSNLPGQRPDIEVVPLSKVRVSFGSSAENPPAPSTDKAVPSGSAEVDRGALSCSRPTESSGVVSILPVSPSQIRITLTKRENSNNLFDQQPNMKAVPLSKVRVIHVACADTMNIYNNE